MRLARRENLPKKQMEAWFSQGQEIRRMIKDGLVERDPRIYVVDIDGLLQITCADFIPISHNVIQDYIKLDVVGVRGSAVVRLKNGIDVWVGPKEVKRFREDGAEIIYRVPWR